MSSALSRLSIRWRLAIITAALTFAILCVFAVAVGQLTASKVRSDFNSENVAAAGELTDQLQIGTRNGDLFIAPALDTFAALNNAVIRIIDVNKGTIFATTRNAPGPRRADPGHRRARRLPGSSPGRPCSPLPGGSSGRTCWCSTRGRSPTSRTRSPACGCSWPSASSRARVWPWAAACCSPSARCRPIAALTATAKEIAETRDPNRRVPQVGGRRRGRRAGAHAGPDAACARVLARGDRGRPRAPARVRGRRLARAAHAADQRAGQPRAAGRGARRGDGRGRPLGAALVPAHAPPGGRPAAAGPRRRPPRGAARPRRPEPGRRRGGRRARPRGRRPRPARRRGAGDRPGRPRRAVPHGAEPHGERRAPHAARHARRAPPSPSTTERSS